MPRYALKIEYHGKPFAGWQKQRDAPSVQQAIETALLKIEPNCAGIQGAGRTDAGVHAYAQVAHVDMQKNWETYRLSEALNYHLKPLPVTILQAAEVTDDFHARFDAIKREYTFRLLSRRAPATHEAGLVWQINHPLDLDAMREGAAHLIGKHDFTTFRSTVCQALSPVKTLDVLNIEAIPVNYGTEYRFTIRARSFLHNQVRSFIGSLEHVGAGRWGPIDVKYALNATDRTACGTVCPPHGLYLTHVTYPNDPFS
ncbi:MAG: tRNA pseudouridine(38-40) synthase TruA [Amylibacter sp.]